MSSVNSEELATPPKHRLSPFEVRNTDLVSRLLAATPPYLYNMPLVPHSYFFSEMLRSLVQSKAEAAARMSNNVPHRRSRKRTWAQGRAEHFSQKQDLKNDSQEMPPPTWTPPKIPDRTRTYETKDRPLELTMNKIPLNNNNISKLNETHENFKTSPSSTITCPEKIDIPQNSQQIPMMFPPIQPPENHSPSSTSSDLILPPPPPIWYPPIYPPPYGIDPLHFFIDLRVSGHIYDRKNQSKEHLPTMESNLPTTSTPSSELSTYTPLSRESRHTSAFSVPNQNPNDPLNLTSKFRFEKPERKFDIKSMGFDIENKQSSNYILKNLTNIYRNINDSKYSEGIDLTSKDDEVDITVKEEEEVSKQDDDKSEKEKKNCKDLRALIGLELVVDYVNHNVKPPKQSITSEESLTDIDSRCSSTSAVEIVTVPDM